jgi:hypothetical protein
MKTLAHASDVLEIRERLLAVCDTDAGLWGQMNVGQMVCHVGAAYRLALTEGEVELVRTPMPPAVSKAFALRSGGQWPKGLPTPPQFKIGGSAMETSDFASGQEALMQAFDRFCAAPNLTKDHPFFATMDHPDWMRWGFLHADHHLRQFGR